MLAPALRATTGEIHTADRDPPALRVGQPQQQVGDGALPHAARADERHHFSRPKLELETVEHRLRASRVAERDTLEPHDLDRRVGSCERSLVTHGRRRLQQPEDSVGDREPICARVVFGPEPPQRKVQLGGEHEDGEACLQAEPAAHEADTDRHRDQGHAQGRGQLEDGAGQEGDPERPHRRPPIALADVCERRRLSPGPVERPQRGQPAHHVEEVGRQEAQGEPPLPGSLLRVTPDQPHEHRDERERGEHHQRRAKVDRGHEHQDGHGNDTGEHQLRQVPGEVGLEAVDALTAAATISPSSAAVRRPRLAAEAPLDEVQPKLGEHRVGRAAAGDLERPGERAAGGEGEREQEHVGPQGRRGRAVEGSGHDPRQQERLQQHDESGGHAGGDVQSQQPPRSARAREQL